MGRQHVPLRKKGANIVVRRNVEKLRLRAPCLRWPVLAAADTRAEFAALVGARTLRFIDDGYSCLPVNRLEHVVIRERKCVDKPHLSPIPPHTPHAPITTPTSRLLHTSSAD